MEGIPIPGSFALVTAITGLVLCGVLLTCARVLAQRKGRTGIGWYLLALIFLPFVILLFRALALAR